MNSVKEKNRTKKIPARPAAYCNPSRAVRVGIAPRYVSESGTFQLSGNLKTGTGKASECQEIRCRKDPNFQNFGTFQLSRGAFQQFCLALARRPPAGPAAGPAAAGSQAPALLGDGRQSTHTTCTGLRFVEKHASCGRSQSPRDFLEEVVPCSEKP